MWLHQLFKESYLNMRLYQDILLVSEMEIIIYTHTP